MKQVYQNTGVMPETLKREPHLNWVLAPYAEAYLKLERRRQIGYASGQPLSTTDILSFGYAHDFGADIDFFYRVISALDDEYIKKEGERMKKGTKGSAKNRAAKGPKRGRRR